MGKVGNMDTMSVTLVRNLDHHVFCTFAAELQKRPRRTILEWTQKYAGCDLVLICSPDGAPTVTRRVKLRS